MHCKVIGILYTEDVAITLHTKFLACKSVDSWFTFVVSLPPQQMTPLHLAAKSGRIETVNYLVEKGPDVNIQDDKGVFICYTNGGRLGD